MAEKISCILIEDEPLALKLLERYAEESGMLEILESTGNPLKAVSLIQNLKPELLISDIQMPGINGLEIFETLETKPLLIFTTAFPEYAVKGFELDAVDYLLKPFDFQRFIKAIKKAEVLLESSAQKPNPEKIPESIFVRSEYSAVRIPLNEIEYIEGMDSYVKIFAGSRPVLSLMTMKAVLEMLPADRFFRVHRSFIVPIDKILSIRNKTIFLKEKEIPIGSTYEAVLTTITGQLFAKKTKGKQS
jgi:two-component system LytT family response regulator